MTDKPTANIFTVNCDSNREGPVLTVKGIQQALLALAEIGKYEWQKKDIIHVYPNGILIHPSNPHNYHIYHRGCDVCKYLMKEANRKRRLRHAK